MTDTKELIISLASEANQLFQIADSLENVHDAEKKARQALGYHEAANALLHRFAEFYSELIDLPVMVSNRRFARKYNL